jgi:hypothetical protein
MIYTREMDVAVDFSGIDYHLSEIMLTPDASHGHVFIFAQKFKVETPLAIPPLQ